MTGPKPAVREQHRPTPGPARRPWSTETCEFAGARARARQAALLKASEQKKRLRPRRECQGKTVGCWCEPVASL